MKLDKDEKTIKYAKKFQEDYCDVINIITQLEGENSLQDPENEPFRSMYASRSMLFTLFNFVNLKNFKEEEEKLLVYLFVQLRLANNYLETEEKSEARKLLEEIYRNLLEESNLPIEQILKDEIFTDDRIACIFGGQLVILFASLGLAYSPVDEDLSEKKQPIFWLNKALRIGQNLMQKENIPFFYESFLYNENILPFFQHFSEHNNLSIEKFTLKNLLTQLLYMTGQAFLNSGNRNNSAVLLQKTIAEVINDEAINENFELDMKKNSKSFQITNPIFFVNINHLKRISLANNSASLAVYFTNCYQFYEASDCLLSATELILSISPSEEGYEETLASVCRVFAEHLLNLFKVTLDDREKSKVPIQKKFKENTSNLFKLTFDKALTFWQLKDINYLLVYPKDYAQSSSLFKMIEYAIDKAEEYFKYDGKCTDYVLLERMRSEGLMYLANFEENPKTRSCLHKKRINTFKIFLDELTSNHFDALKVGLSYNLAEAYYDYRESKESELENERDKDRYNHLLDKLIKICKFCIDAYAAFLRRYSSQSEKKFKVNIFKEKCKEPGDVSMLIQSCIHQAQLYSLLSTKLNVSNDNNGLLKAIEAYKLAIHLAELNNRYKLENGRKEFNDTEVQLASEMIELLSMRLKNLSL